MSFVFFLAEYLHICQKADPNLKGCIETSIETLRPFLIKGIPSLDVPSIDPIDIGNLLVSEKTQSNGLHITAKNIRAFGASTFKLKNLEWVILWYFTWRRRSNGDVKWCIFFTYRIVDYGKVYNVDVFFPRLHVEGIYDVSGQILLLPIRGSGPFIGNFSKFNFTSISTGSKF